jgi:hypothetical protein
MFAVLLSLDDVHSLCCLEVANVRILVFIDQKVERVIPI